MVNLINAYLRLKVTPTPQHGILSLDKYKLNFSNQIFTLKKIYLKMIIITEHRQHFHAF